MDTLTVIGSAIINAIMERTSKPISLKSRLVEDLGLDSLALLELMLSLESEFKIHIDYVDSKMYTVRDLIVYIQQLLGAPAA